MPGKTFIDGPLGPSIIVFRPITGIISKQLRSNMLEGAYQEIPLAHIRLTNKTVQYMDSMCRCLRFNMEAHIFLNGNKSLFEYLVKTFSKDY